MYRNMVPIRKWHLDSGILFIKYLLLWIDVRAIICNLIPRPKYIQKQHLHKFIIDSSKRNTILLTLGLSWNINKNI